MTITITQIQYYPCYFCQRLLSGGLGQVHWRCQPCAQEYQLYEVITTADGKSPIYAHIFPTEGLQVRMHLRDNLTFIEKAETGGPHDHLIKMQGFPITLKNAKEKVKLYLTFS